jgi:hypothetical protein
MSVHDANYKKIRKHLGIKDDEPIFILRAQDNLANGILGAYLVEAEGVSPPEFVEGVREAREAFWNWRQRNPGRCKVAD